MIVTYGHSRNGIAVDDDGLEVIGKRSDGGRLVCAYDEVFRLCQHHIVGQQCGDPEQAHQPIHQIYPANIQEVWYDRDHCIVNFTVQEGTSAIHKCTHGHREA